ncbi:TD and POZ domain-containing protein 5 [Trichonephila clavipes]|nr:TD and POZ domain-containing protein 5 [Trichonephila clavipes]
MWHQRFPKIECEVMNENKCFTFTWVIENFSYSWHSYGEFISSPAFAVNMLGNTKWRLELYPKGSNGEGEFISFNLKRDGRKGPEILDVYYELSFLASDYSVSDSSGLLKYSFVKGEGCECPNYVKREETLKLRSNNYLPGNVLAARCRMWNNFQEVVNFGQCFARSRIVTERRSYVWNIKQFSLFRESFYEIFSASTEQSMIKLKFIPGNGQNYACIGVEKCAHVELKLFTFRLYLVDSSGDRTECLEDEVSMHEGTLYLSNKLNFSNEQLMTNKNQYLSNDVLQLLFECAIATGIVWEGIENINFGCPPSIQDGNLTSDDLKLKMPLDSTRILKENLKSFYKENLLCDTKLNTKTRSFPAHKNILSARSPVFKAMFTHDMKEKNSECVDIEDLDDETVQRLLLYIYTATLQDLRWDSACNLYAAADKYEIPSLKSECFSFLKDNLTINNACDLLVLADKHQDEDLKSDVQYYILNQNNTFNTNEWKQFMKTNLQLAADVMYLKCKK